MFNSSEANLTSYHKFSKHFYYLPQIILIFVVAISAVISNAVFLIAVFRNPVVYRVRDSPVSLLVVNLGVCDLLAAVVPGCGGIYYNISLLNRRIREDLYGARIVISTFGIVTCIVSICTISAMSVERFHAISSPLRHKPLTISLCTLRVKVFLVFTWIYSILFACLSLALSYRGFDPFYCHVHVTLPLIILPVVYWKTYTALRFHNRNTVGNLCYSNEPEYLYSQKQRAEIVVSTIVLVNCVFNPFNYAWRIPKYRRAFKAVFGRCDCCRRLNTLCNSTCQMTPSLGGRLSRDQNTCTINRYEHNGNLTSNTIESIGIR
ncbi:D(2) dopamine receptor-like [Montipora foliosa]|uniref:D(2) dopamine receptor-like n=1 Tax=Montipora foliosa TaxID=591990 RepID=UPI0035F1DE7F